MIHVDEQRGHITAYDDDTGTILATVMDMGPTCAGGCDGDGTDAGSGVRLRRGRGAVGCDQAAGTACAREGRVVTGVGVALLLAAGAGIVWAVLTTAVGISHRERGRR